MRLRALSEFEAVDLFAAAAFGGRRGGGHAFRAGAPGALRGGVLAPDCAAHCTALVVALEEIGDGLGQQVTLGAFGFGVHGARPVVVGQDHPEVVGDGHPQVMVQLSDQPGLREVADEAAAKLQAAIDSLQSADAR